MIGEYSQVGQANPMCRILSSPRSSVIQQCWQLRCVQIDVRSYAIPFVYVHVHVHCMYISINCENELCSTCMYTHTHTLFLYSVMQCVKWSLVRIGTSSHCFRCDDYKLLDLEHSEVSQQTIKSAAHCVQLILNRIQQKTHACAVTSLKCRPSLYTYMYMYSVSCSKYTATYSLL